VQGSRVEGRPLLSHADSFSGATRHSFRAPQRGQPEGVPAARGDVRALGRGGPNVSIVMPLHLGALSWVAPGAMHVYGSLGAAR
jgi:hypothetical protein